MKTRLYLGLIALLLLFASLAAHAVEKPIYAWGFNGAGQLGNGTGTDTESTPVQTSNLTDVLQVSGGTFHSLALKSDGTVWAWGLNDNGRLGDGTATGRNTPVQISNLTGMAQVSAGNRHSLALKSDGTVWAWGGNSSGQLGDGTTNETHSRSDLQYHGD
ncbi:MAG: hypothetical protein NT023_00490 [Armatimonadetes bacterium]|nr:hypothetical protein [Armatimonadota bacterium]